MAYYLGMDVGGTKTHCLVADERGYILGFGSAGCGSYEYHGVAPAVAENRRALEAALADASLSIDDIDAVGLGVAGADLPEDFEMLEREIYGPLFRNLPRQFKNDSMAALRGGTRADDAIVIVCGTGSVCAGRNEAGEETRAGGIGPEFGDQCTGTLLGHEGIQTVWRARDGIDAPTLMTEKFVARSGCKDVDELFYALYRRTLPYTSLEPMAQVVFQAALEGDAAARAILVRGGTTLSAMVCAVADKLNLMDTAFEVIMAGSIFKGESPDLIDAMKKGIASRCPSATCRRPAFEPVVGALLMAFEQVTALTDTVYDGLEATLPETEERHGITLRAF